MPKKSVTNFGSSVNNDIDCGSVPSLSEGISNQKIEILNSQDSLDRTLTNILENSLNISGSSDADESCLDVNSSDLQVSSKEVFSSRSPINSSDCLPSQFYKPARYACKRNGKSIFADQDREDTFFLNHLIV